MCTLFTFPAVGINCANRLLGKDIAESIIIKQEAKNNSPVKDGDS